MSGSVAAYPDEEHPHEFHGIAETFLHFGVAAQGQVVAPWPVAYSSAVGLTGPRPASWHSVTAQTTRSCSARDPSRVS